MTTKYDALLGLMPTGLVGGGIAHAIGFDLSTLVAGGVFSLFVMAWCLFVDPPRDPALGPHQ